MHQFFKKLAILLVDIGYILSPSYRTPHRMRLLGTYIRVRSKASFNRFFHFTHERFLGFSVSVIDYDIFFAIFQQIFIRRVYYFETSKAQPVIFDGGGNIGMSTLYFKYLYPKSRITIFEPTAAVLPVLKENVERNNLSHITIIEAALTSTDGTAQFFHRGAAACGNTLEKSLFEAAQTKKDSTNAYENVATARLSPYIKKHGFVDFLKLDIEGSEGEVFRELATSGMLSSVHATAFEYHFQVNDANNLDAIMQTFRQSDFAIAFYFDETVFIPPNPREPSHVMIYAERASNR